MKLKQGIAVAAAALAVIALPVSSAFAAGAGAEPTTELHYCEGLPGEAGECAGVAVPTAEWPQADSTINTCLEGIPTWTAGDAESCILKWNPSAVVTRSIVDQGATSHRRLKHKRHHAKGRHSQARAVAQASRA